MAFKLSRIKLELPSGNSVTVRRISPQDMLACGLTPDLVTNSSSATPSNAENVRSLMERIIVRACVEPKFCVAEKDAVEDKVIWVGELTFEEVDIIAGGVFKASGMTEGAKEEMRPFVETNSL